MLFVFCSFLRLKVYERDWEGSNLSYGGARQVLGLAVISVQ